MNRIGGSVLAWLLTSTVYGTSAAFAAGRILAIQPEAPRPFEPIHVEVALDGCRTLELYPSLVGDVFRVGYLEGIDPDFCISTTTYQLTIGALPPGEYRVEIGPTPQRDSGWLARDGRDFAVKSETLPPLDAAHLRPLSVVDYSGLWTVVAAPGGTVMHLYSHTAFAPFDAVTLSFQTFLADGQPTWNVLQARRTVDGDEFVGAYSSAALVGASAPQLRLTRLGEGRLEFDSPVSGALIVTFDSSGTTQRHVLRRFRHR